MVDRQLIIQLIQKGIPLSSLEPYADLASKAHIPTSELINEVKVMLNDGTIKRFGAVVKNRSIGKIFNAMVTLKVPFEKIDYLGNEISKFEFVTLCYQREPIIGVWDYNLYFMIHGYSRETVLEQISTIKTRFEINESDIKILFSTKCFKQRGAFY